MQALSKQYEPVTQSTESLHPPPTGTELGSWQTRPGAFWFKRGRRRTVVAGAQDAAAAGGDAGLTLATLGGLAPGDECRCGRECQCEEE